MIIVIIAGGSGTRLWPISTPDYPKHLLKINGDKLSLLQHTYERAKLITDKIYVVSEASHIHHVQEQLPDLSADSFICEPGRKGTANCIVAALEHIGRTNNPDEPIASIHSDHYIRDLAGFTYSFKVANNISAKSNRIVLVGVEPDNPATGFGYIEKGELLSDEPFAFNVNTFKEKPDFETARSYLRSGNYLWNCGYFVGSINTFKKSMNDHATDLYANYQKLVDSSKDLDLYNQTYLSFENMAIDYALIEKVADLAVVPATFDWMDMGSFSDLSLAMGGDQAGNNTLGNVELEEVENSLVQNYEDKPLAVIGLDNIVVINNENGILVARKDLAQKVGEVSKKLSKGNKS
jgi:mannose-1-phosphate guanylyltransferase/mannose-6-phosphate isomerase